MRVLREKTMRATSIAAFEAIIPKLPKCQRRTFEFFSAFPGTCAQDLLTYTIANGNDTRYAETLRKRISELIKKGILYIAGTKVVDGKLQNTYTVDPSRAVLVEQCKRESKETLLQRFEQAVMTNDMFVEAFREQVLGRMK